MSESENNFLKNSFDVLILFDETELVFKNWVPKILGIP